jgi:hypothetical protein
VLPMYPVHCVTHVSGPDLESYGGDDGTRTRDLCRDRLGIFDFSATYILAGAAKSLKRTVGTLACG